MTSTPAGGAAVAAEEVPGRAGRPLPEVPGVRHRFVDAGGVWLRVAEAGPAGQDRGGRDPVVLLHSFPQHGLMSGEYRLICSDLRGFGWSEAPARGYDSATRVRDVLGLLDALGVSRVALVGRVEVPSLILAGARDPVTPPAILAPGERLALAGRMAVEIVPGAGQFLPAEQPGLVAAAARRLFAGDGPEGGNNGGDGSKPGD